MAYLSSVRTVCAALAILFFCTNAAKAETAVVSVDLNLRYGPGFEHLIMLTIPGGSVLDVEDCEYGWCYVYWTDYEGYVSEEYLQFGGYAGYAQQYVPPPVIVNRYYPRHPYAHYRDDRRKKAYRYNPRHDFAYRGNGRGKQVLKPKPRRKDVHKKRGGNKNVKLRNDRKKVHKKVRKKVRKAIKQKRHAVKKHRGKPKARGGGNKRKKAARGGGNKRKKAARGGGKRGKKKAKARKGGSKKAEKRNKGRNGKGRGRKRG